jgi:hypothetical protein
MDLLSFNGLPFSRLFFSFSVFERGMQRFERKRKRKDEVRRKREMRDVLGREIENSK